MTVVKIDGNRVYNILHKIVKVLHYPCPFGAGGPAYGVRQAHTLRDDLPSILNQSVGHPIRATVYTQVKFYFLKLRMEP
jgi:hypothetical protein